MLVEPGQLLQAGSLQGQAGASREASGCVAEQALALILARANAAPAPLGSCSKRAWQAACASHNCSEQEVLRPLALSPMVSQRFSKLRLSWQTSGASARSQSGAVGSGAAALLSPELAMSFFASSSRSIGCRQSALDAWRPEDSDRLFYSLAERLLLLVKAPCHA